MLTIADRMRDTARADMCTEWGVQRGWARWARPSCSCCPASGATWQSWRPPVSAWTPSTSFQRLTCCPVDLVNRCRLHAWICHAPDCHDEALTFTKACLLRFCIVAHCRLHEPQVQALELGCRTDKVAFCPSDAVILCCAKLWNTVKREIDLSIASSRLVEAASFLCSNLQAAAVGPEDASASCQCMEAHHTLC